MHGTTIEIKKLEMLLVNKIRFAVCNTLEEVHSCP